MKKAFFVSFIVVFFMTSGLAAQDFSVAITGNILFPADKDYKKVYGDTVFFPEIKAGYQIASNISIWAGFGLLSATGTTYDELQQPAKSTKNFLSLGLGYGTDPTRKIGFKIEAGVVYIKYKEEALELVIEDSAIGFRGNVGIVFNVSSTFFLEACVGYIHATDEVEVEGVTESLKLGGFTAGAGMGIRF